jgi:tetratricopeptide (TPR) repeat protein/DNA-binding CsgD family transcriptional regulator
MFLLICCTGFANANLFGQARRLQHDGKYGEAIEAFKNYLLQPIDENEFDRQQQCIYSEALMQLMNSFQSKGEPETCVSVLQECFDSSPLLQGYCLRDFYSVMGYALSRTEKMKEAEEMTLKVFTLPLHEATPERYFRDYAYAAAVFYSNPSYQNEVVMWCEEALNQAKLATNTSGQQWVIAMLGSAYKRNGHLNKALNMFLQSKTEASQRNDDLGVLNSLHVLIDLFLYWDIPEYADIYASEAIKVERMTTMKNPMVSTQTYIDKGRALLELGMTDSVSFYAEKAKEFCGTLPYNSGMVDVDLLNGIYMTEKGGDSIHKGIHDLLNVTRQGTITNRAKAYHQLAQTYFRMHEDDLAEIMLDNMYSLLCQEGSVVYIQIDYEPILSHYLNKRDRLKIEQYVRLMIQEQQRFKEKKLNFKLVDAIVAHQTQQKRDELEMSRLKQTNQRLWLIICLIISLVVISAIGFLLFYQRKQHKFQMQQADEKLASLVEKLNDSYAEKDMIAREIDEIMSDKDNRQEIISLTPSVLQKNGESKFRQRFEVIYPLFLPRLREKIPSITRREELLAMLLVLKQDNKEIAELMAIAPRSVLMLRHRLRQKIGISTDNSLETYIEETLGEQSK